MTTGRVTQTFVIGDDTLELVADGQRRGQVQRVQRPEDHRIKLGGTFEDLGRQFENDERVKTLAHCGRGGSRVTASGAKCFRPQEV